jgi:ubiquinone biosynthesis protein Coq4
VRHGLLESYQHGRDAKPLLPVYWERYWEEPMDDVRRRFGVARCTMN